MAWRGVLNTAARALCEEKATRASRDEPPDVSFSRQTSRLWVRMSSPRTANLRERCPPNNALCYATLPTYFPGVSPSFGLFFFFFFCPFRPRWFSNSSGSLTCLMSSNVS